MGSGKKQEVVIIAVGGPTCSGKTTLSKHLRRILPNSVILHQDDFAPPSEQIPIHPVHGVQDWDDPRGAIDWPRLRKTLADLHADPAYPLPASHDDLNVLPDVPVDISRLSSWTKRFEALDCPTRYVIVDGFLLYWDQACASEYDVQFFVRESYEVLKERRRVRQMYFTADGKTWIDPPGYWDDIIWPAYLLAHQHMFLNHDVQDGELDRSSWAGKDVVMLQPAKGGLSETTMAEFIERTLQTIYEHVQKGQQ